MKNYQVNQSNFINNTFRILFIVSVLFMAVMPVSVQASNVPVTGNSPVSPVRFAGNQPEPTTYLPSLDTFVENLASGEADQIVGVYQEDLFAQRVVQQPANDAAYVSPFDNQVTQFNMVNSLTGNLGLLAHNYLSGKYFFEMEIGAPIEVVFGDGSVEEFEVSQILSYQALSPHDVYSDFVNVDTGAKLSATNLFEQVYGGSYHLTLQTCIRKGDEFSWGRLFVIATPVESH